MGSHTVLVVGGGAAGFFAAIAAAEAAAGRGRVILCEATAHPLAKVRVSGGGRCNVTHACPEPRELIQRYPRGSRELLGAFHRFGPRDTVAWFAERGVELKTESDGRMFPVTDSSGTIVDCLQSSAAKAGVEVRTRCGVTAVTRGPGGVGFNVTLATGSVEQVDRLILAQGGPKEPKGRSLAESLGHTLEPPVPSLFTFHVVDPRLTDLAGLSVEDAASSVPGTSLRERGPLLITHWGVSGPAVLKLSAWGARELATRNYRFSLELNFAPEYSRERAREALVSFRSQHPKRQVSSGGPFGIPSRLWERLVTAAGIGSTTPWSQTSNDAVQALTGQVVAAMFAVTGKSMNKEEFVTCGGVRRTEVDFRTLESRVCPGLYCVGELLDVDGITGGFNFQAAWTTGWLAGRASMAPVTASDPAEGDR